jgi:hypothetical protein
MIIIFFVILKINYYFCSFHQSPRAVEAPAFMHGGKAQANLFAVRIVLKCITIAILFVNC